MTSPYVVCVGHASRDTILAVPANPEPDGIVLASDLAVAGGGPAATAAVALVRLGVPAFFVGAVGDDEAGAFIAEGLATEGVNLSGLAVVPGARSPQSTVLVDEQSGARAIAAFRGALPPLELHAETRDLCRGAAWVHIDQTGYRAVSPLRGEVRLSIDGGNPIDGLDLHDVALYAPTEAALHAAFGTPAGALEAGAELVVVTRGEEGSEAHTRSGEVIRVPGHRVEAVSTLGAGDVFHGALLAQLVGDVPLREALVFANTCAALSCRALDGRSAIPTAEEVTA